MFNVINISCIFVFQLATNVFSFRVVLVTTVRLLPGCLQPDATGDKCLSSAKGLSAEKLNTCVYIFKTPNVNYFTLAMITSKLPVTPLEKFGSSGLLEVSV